MQKGLPATAGSKMLANFIAPFDATVVTRLEAAGVQIIGRCDVGEFGVDGSFSKRLSQYVGTNCVRPFADSNADIALCNDYTGAVSLAAAEQGLYYIHPTYGSVSRYGLIPAVSSIDQIGVLCKNPEVGFEVLKIISEYDNKDGVMTEDAKHHSGKWKVESGKLGDFQSKYSEIFPQIMQILCCAELANNISRYDGIKFGYRAEGYNGLRELYTKSRTESFGENVKLAAVIGAMVLSQENYTRYYDKAMRLRRLIRDSLELDPTVVGTNCVRPPLLTLSRLCGLPSLTTPNGVYIANAGREDLLCNTK